jgi:hypothetical protein
MCKHLFENEEVFKEYIADLLLDLAYDNITNVRITLAEFISNLIKKEKYAHLKKNETVRKIVKILKNDKAEEVKSLMKDINDVEDIDVELNKEVNYKFKDLMKFVSSEFGITRNVPLQNKFNADKFSEDKKEEETKEEETKEEEKKEEETKTPGEKEKAVNGTEEGKKEDKKEETETKKEETTETKETNTNENAGNGSTEQ